MNETITFSSDSEKNVTIIMGQNGTGKTTLAQAFTWCLYGDTQFEDKIILSKSAFIKMTPKDEESVKVEIGLNHNNIDYTITRKQKFFLDNNGNIKSNPTEFSISFKKDGQQEWVRELDCIPVMNSILPNELSKYFFFDGERIVKMGKDIQKGTSKEFSEAVTSLLGLRAFKEALKHLYDANNSVIRTYAKSYDASSNIELSTIISKIADIEREIEILNNRLESIKNEEALAQDKCREYEAKIQKYEESITLMQKREDIKIKLQNIESARKNGFESIFSKFNKAAQTFFAKKMIHDALKQLRDADSVDKGIPDITEKTINYLIKRKECICGHIIDFNSNEYHTLIKLLEFIPPKSIGNQISQFLNTCKLKHDHAETLFNDISDQFKILKENIDESELLKSDLQNIDKRLTSMENVGLLQQKLISCEKSINDLKNERDSINQKIGDFTNSLNNLTARRKELTLKDEKNSKIETYKAYAEHLYDTIKSLYTEKETETREILQNKINMIFKHIYNGGLSLSLDKNYFVDVRVTNVEGYNSGIETSTAQSISVIFAFIAGVIEMAKESKNDENKMLVSEPYPLVMDAPLSAFDTTRIKTVCDILPTVAQQVIIFIKDTDGILAEQHMGGYLGARYELEKLNEFETKIQVR
jgi:DNA sulfur modification protein DndD